MNEYNARGVDQIKMELVRIDHKIASTAPKVPFGKQRYPFGAKADLRDLYERRAALVKQLEAAALADQSGGDHE